MKVQLLRGMPLAITVMAFVVSCRKERLLATAKSNAKQYALARCECELLQRKDPPGDLTLCSEQMQQAQRYLTFNIEMGKLSAKDQAEVRQYGDKVFQDCMAQAGQAVKP